jgi:hypothetical protein
MTHPACDAPIESAMLADYWLAELPPEQEAAIEEHLLACEICSKELQEIAAFAGGIGNLARQGNLRLVISRSFLDRMAAAGLKVREYAPPEHGKVHCTVTGRDDLLIARLTADLTGVERMDLVFHDPTGREIGRLRDIPFNAARGEVILNEPIEPMRAAPASVLMMKLVSVDAAGERLVGEYTFDHTPS